jgi:ABC-type dipeptide/oligopeptide/nickel transport system permease subunit
LSADKKTGWKDSNWYVSIRGFADEYRKHRIGMFGVILLIIFLGMAAFAPYLVVNSPDPSARIAAPFQAPAWTEVFDPNAVTTREYMPDPFFASAPGEVIAGNSTEFGVVHHAAASEQDTSYMNLTWTHTANTPLGFIVPLIPFSQLPDCRDFVYVNETFDWPVERLPTAVNFTIEYGVTLSGSFLNETNGGLMFRVYVWVIDSSGNWTMIYKSSPPYTSIIQGRRVLLSSFEIEDGWAGMIKDKDGIQEDPKDQITVAIGLAPTSQFRYFSGEYPWKTYNGSVTLQVMKASMICYGGYYGILGTTDKGADAWSQLVFGTRMSLTIGVLATALSTVVGVVVGLVAGYAGGKVDELLMRVVDFLLVIPGLPLMMILAAFLGRSAANIIVVLAILGWTGTARLIRSQVMAEKNKAYVESARAIGASDTYIIFRHVLPNVTPILFATITLGVVGAILSEAGLAFLGLTDPTQPSWGIMLADAQTNGAFSVGAWWVVLFPGLMITGLSLAFTFIGHTLDQVLNPRLRER